MAPVRRWRPRRGRAAPAPPPAGGGRPAGRTACAAAPRTPWSAGRSSPPPRCSTGVFVLRPLGITAQYSFYEWNGVGPSTPGRARQLRPGPHRPGAVRLARPRLHAHPLLQRRPGAARPGDRGHHPPHRHHAGWPRSPGPSCSCPQVIPLVAAGITWSWLLSSHGRGQPAAAGGRPRRRRPGLARRLRHGPARGRRHRRLGAARAVHAAAAVRHDQDRPGAVRGRPHRRRRAGAGVPRPSPCPACVRRSASA